MLPNYLWELVDCDPPSRSIFEAQLTMCVQSNLTGASGASLPLSSAQWRDLKAACKVRKNTNQLEFIQLLKKPTGDIVSVESFGNESATVLHWWAHKLGLQVTQPCSRESLATDLAAGVATLRTPIGLSVDEIAALGSKVMVRLVNLREDLPNFSFYENDRAMAVGLASNGGVSSEEAAAAMKKRRKSPSPAKEVRPAKEAAFGTFGLVVPAFPWQTPAAAAIALTSGAGLVTLVEPMALASGMFLVDFNEFMAVHKVLQVTNGRAVDAIDVSPASFALPTKAVGCWDRRVLRESWKAKVARGLLGRQRESSD